MTPRGASLAGVDDDRAPVGEVLGEGFLVPRLPKGWTPLEGIVLVKCLDDEGHSSWAFRMTRGVNDEELLGALTVRLELAKRETVDLYSEPED